MLGLSLNAKECSPYFNPDKYYDANDNLVELIQNNLHAKGLSLFGESSSFKTLNFKKEKDYFLTKGKLTVLKDYIYPTSNGLWKYKTNAKNITELSIAQVELYRYKEEEIAAEINDSYDNLWSDWIEDGYEMQLTPEQTLFRYNDKYFSFSVYIYGFKGDSTPLKGTVINYWFKDYTKQVNQHIQCKKDKNDS